MSIKMQERADQATTLVRSIRAGMAAVDEAVVKLNKNGDALLWDKTIGLLLNEIGEQIRQNYGHAFKKELDRYSNVDLVQFYISAGFDREVEELLAADEAALRKLRK